MPAKRERVDDDDEEMDIDDDDDDQAGPPAPTSNSTSCIYCTQLLNRVYIIIFGPHLAQVQPSNKLHCSNLPQEVTNGVLAVLFQQCVLMAYTSS